MEPGRGRAEASFSSAVIRARKQQFVGTVFNAGKINWRVGVSVSTRE